MGKSDHEKEVLQLLIENRAVIFGFILASVCDHNAAEDIFQEVAVAVCESADKFSIGTNFKAWAREIARRRILAFRREKKKMNLMLEPEILELIEQGFEKMETRTSVPQHIGALRRCLSRVKDQVRHLLHLRYGREFTLAAVSEATGVNPESVRKTLYRTRIKLRACIQSKLKTKETIY